MTDKEKSTIQEMLVTLYLRLNGYFSTGFVIHSTEEGKVEGEVDLIGVRFPGHKQDYTEHGTSEFLEVPNNIDIIIAEVKAKGQRLQFNNSLRQQLTLEPWKKILHWVGLIAEERIYTAAVELNSLVQTIANSNRQKLLSTNFPTDYGYITIRPIIFSPERISSNNADKFINWVEVNDFIWQCLCPADSRKDCGTRYDFTAWGYGLSKVVKAYKGRQKSQIKFVSIEELYADIVKLEVS